ncbi:MAG: ATP-dependent DNA helicase [Agathobacter sp.]
MEGHPGEIRKELHTSVRNLVEFIFREGDIDNRAGRLASAEAMLEGSRIHRKIQKSMDSAYQAEVPLSLSIEEKDYTLVIEGRADGIAYGEFLSEPEEICYIDEIKGIYRKLSTMEEPVYVHKAQAMCYAYIYALQNHLSRIGLQMTYCNLDTEEIRYFREILDWDTLKAWFDHLIAEYRKWADWQMSWRKMRQESIRRLEFPFPYREGQKKLVTDVYRTIMRRKTLFIEAPTGVGKTVSTIFPAVKAVGEELSDRIFYLTAKTVTASVAKETIGLLMEHGYQAKTIHLTAKEKLCLCDEMDCNPQHCPYARGHYDRVNDAVFDLLQRKDLFTREDILAQAEKYCVCPFEMSLDTASFADNIICDYNYVFDPRVALKRFFQDGVKGDYIFLVDEAHNLVDRSREMYSAVLYKEEFLEIKRLMKTIHPAIVRAAEKCNRDLLEMKRECEGCQVRESVGTLTFHLMRLATLLDEFLEKPVEFPEKKKVLDFYFALRNFLNIYDLVDDRYVIYTDFEEDGRFGIHLFCVDPSENLQKCIAKSNSTVFFSATLLPITYYKSLLSTEEDNYAIYAKSTFAEKNRLIAFGKGVSTRYKRRGQKEYEKIAAYIESVICGRVGNYMIFFPSYQLMREVYEVFQKREMENPIWDRILEAEDSPSESEHSLQLAMQTSGMKEQEREKFLEAFEETKRGTFAAFCVMGGIFAEGIDLKRDRLIGAVIVGTGLPQISHEREILKKYYDERGMNGFDYAFRFPGMNKVLQAAGRVIRTAEDQGVILLLDERFLEPEYDRLFPREWAQRKICTVEELAEEVADFWGKEPCNNEEKPV